jgi:cytochrome c peroxidase
LGRTNLKRNLIILAIAAATAGGAQTLENLFPLENASGYLETYNRNGTSLDLSGAFFQALGANGRSCSSCHRAAEGWSVSAAEVKSRFEATQGLDPIFRTNDGSNCDHNINVSTVGGRRQAYSLLVQKGLLRIALAAPAGAEFTVAGVQNKYGCTDPATLSVYRRPLPSTNLIFLSTVMWDGRESSSQTGTQPITFPGNPNDLLADLGHQAVDATTGHAQGLGLTSAQQQDIVAFEIALATAQAIDKQAGALNTNGANGGPMGLAGQPFYIGTNDSFPTSFGFNPFATPFTPVIFNLYDAWSNPGSHPTPGPVPGADPRRASIARGQSLFNSKPIVITRVAGINDVLGPVITGTCGTCHDSPNLGNHSFAVALNIGVGDLDSPLDVSYLPVISLRNNTTGEIVHTTDPGRALISGKWADIGKLKGPILRGLPSRAPYFHNGSADTLTDVVTFYDKRFHIGFTPQEKADLIAFLNML